MQDNTVELAYGDGTVPFSINELGRCETISGRPVPALANPRDAIRDAVRSPIGSPPLRESVAPGNTVAILTPDISRVAHSDLYLPIIVEELTAAGVREHDITIIFARGTHRPNTSEEQQRLTGELWGRVRAVDHDCTAPDSVRIGITSRGTPVEINPIAATADRVIATGAIVYHYFAGFGGGRKTVLPGVASFDTVQANHRWSLHPAAGSGLNPLASAGALRGNPVHEDMEEAAAMLGPAFLLNVVVNDRRELAGVFAGHWQDAHAAGVRFVEGAYRVNLRERADLVITSPGGYPKDINFYQAYKAVAHASWAVRPGGAILLVAECRDGMGGHGDFAEWLRLGSSAAMEAQLRQRHEVVGQVALMARITTEQLRIVLLSRLPDDHARLLNVTPERDPQQALAMALDTAGARRSPRLTYIMPQGYVTFPVVAGWEAGS